MAAAYEAEGICAGRTRLMLTAAVGAGKETIDQGYEVDKIHKYIKDTHVPKNSRHQDIFPS